MTEKDIAELLLKRAETLKYSGMIKESVSTEALKGIVAGLVLALSAIEENSTYDDSALVVSNLVMYATSLYKERDRNHLIDLLKNAIASEFYWRRLAKGPFVSQSIIDSAWIKQGQDRIKLEDALKESGSIVLVKEDGIRVKVPRSHEVTATLDLTYLNSKGRCLVTSLRDVVSIEKVQESNV